MTRQGAQDPGVHRVPRRHDVQIGETPHPRISIPNEAEGEPAIRLGPDRDLSLPALDSHVQVTPVHSWWDRQRWVAFPYRLYRNHPYWVPPLRREQRRTISRQVNPFFEHGFIQPFLALDGQGTVIGRIAAIVNGHHLARYQDGVGFFGFFECVERDDAARCLFDAASTWLGEKGLLVMRGPTNPSIHDTSGLLVDGFDLPPSIMMPYNPAYYRSLLERYGFRRVMTMWAYRGMISQFNVERLRRGSTRVRQRHPGLVVRPLEMRRFASEARMIHQLYNASFEDGWGNVSISEAEFMHSASTLKSVLDPALALCVEDEGQPVGFSLSLPDVNPLLRHLPDGRLLPFGWLRLLLKSRTFRARDVRTVLIGVRPDYRHRGLDNLLVLESIDNALRGGYLAGELSWVMDNNETMKNMLAKIGAVRHKEYAMYEMTLPEPQTRPRSSTRVQTPERT